MPNELRSSSSGGFRCGSLLVLCCSALLCLACGAETVAEAGSGSRSGSEPAFQSVERRGLKVSALGRIEPEGGILRLGLPSTPVAINGAIVAEIRVEEGEDVKAGQVLAVSESARVLEAIVEELAAQVVLERRRAAARQRDMESVCALAGVSLREAGRMSRLLKEGVVAEDLQDRAQGDSVANAAACHAANAEVAIAEASIEAAKARVVRARADSERAILRAPTDGRVIEIVANKGELVGSAGLLEFARVERMYAIAEVYETDIARVRVGQRAQVSSPVLSETLTGRVERIRQKVQKQDEMSTDPAARKDARIVEVEVLLDSPMLAASLINLQVEVVVEK